MTVPNVAAIVAEEIADLRRALARTDAKDQDGLLDILNRLTALHQAAEEIRSYVAETAPGLVTQALGAEIDQDDLVGRPYGETVVRRLAREAGLPPRRPGPRRRRGRTLPPQS